MPEEKENGAGNQIRNSEERLRKRLRRLKRRMRNENRWWRAGAIAALVADCSGDFSLRLPPPSSPPPALWDGRYGPMGTMPGLYGGILDPDLGMGPAGRVVRGTRILEVVLAQTLV
jgi:hypothetical protein